MKDLSTISKNQQQITFFNHLLSIQLHLILKLIITTIITLISSVIFSHKHQGLILIMLSTISFRDHLNYPKIISINQNLSKQIYSQLKAHHKMPKLTSYNKIIKIKINKFMHSNKKSKNFNKLTNNPSPLLTISHLQSKTYPLCRPSPQQNRKKSQKSRRMEISTLQNQKDGRRNVLIKQSHCLIMIQMTNEWYLGKQVKIAIKEMNE